MNFFQQLGDLFSNVGDVTWQQLVMWCVGGLLIFLAIRKAISSSRSAASRYRTDSMAS